MGSVHSLRRIRAAAAVTAGLAIALVLAAPGSALAAFPGSNGKIIFDTGGSGSFRVVNPDGTGQVISQAFGGDAQWSPDGTRIVFTRNVGSPSMADVFVANADGSGSVNITNNPAADTDPAWSPDGSKIVFSSDRDGVAQLYVMNADGTGVTRRTFSGVVDRAPQWAPDGTRIAFVEVTDAARIHLINPDGSSMSGALVALSNGSGGPMDLDWSPDSSKLVFDHFAGPGDADIYTVNRDGTGLTNLTPLPGQDSGPGWSPDGTKIAYVNLNPDFSSRNVWAMNADGSGKAHVTNDIPATYRRPDWQSVTPPSLAPYPRPGSATPLRVPLVPAYATCTASNSTHVAPLSLPSCSPPQQESTRLTTSSTGLSSASAALRLVPDDPSTGPDETDIAIALNSNDVRCRVAGSGCTGAGSDYTGQTLLRTALRLTDRGSGPASGVPATVEDTRFDVMVQCTGTPADPARGSTCNLTGTANSLVPNFAAEGARTVISVLSLTLLDAGADGSVNAGPPNCPPACGTGDEHTYLAQGLFTP